MEFDICSSAGFLKALNIILTILNILKVFVPLLLVFIMSFEIYGLVTNPDNVKKVKDVVLKKLIAALLVFFIPTIIELVLNNIDADVDVARCYQNAKVINEGTCYDDVLHYEDDYIKAENDEERNALVRPNCISYDDNINNGSNSSNTTTTTRPSFSGSCVCSDTDIHGVVQYENGTCSRGVCHCPSSSYQIYEDNCNRCGCSVTDSNGVVQYQEGSCERGQCQCSDNYTVYENNCSRCVCSKTDNHGVTKFENGSCVRGQCSCSDGYEVYENDC